MKGKLQFCCKKKGDPWIHVLHCKLLKQSNLMLWPTHWFSSSELGDISTQPFYNSIWIRKARPGHGGLTFKSCCWFPGPGKPLPLLLLLSNSTGQSFSSCLNWHLQTQAGDNGALNQTAKRRKGTVLSLHDSINQKPPSNYFYFSISSGISTLEVVSAATPPPPTSLTSCILLALTVQASNPIEGPPKVGGDDCFLYIRKRLCEGRKTERKMKNWGCRRETDRKTGWQMR